MPTPFDTLTAASARTLLGMNALSLIPDAATLTTATGTAPSAAAIIKTNRLFMSGDYFQDGEQGAFPGLLEDASGETLAVIEREFATMPALEGIVKRKRRGVVGREPSWDYVLRRALEEEEEPKPDEQTAIDEAAAAATSFWETRGVHRQTQDAVNQLEVTGEIPVRLFVQGASEGEIKKQSTLAGALDIIHWEVLEPNSVYRHFDRTSMRELLGYEFKESYLKPDGVAATRVRLVVTYLDDNRQTVVRSWTDDKEDQRVDTLDLNGQLLLKVIKAPPLISRPLRELQNQLSKSITMMGHNNNLAGFMQLIATGLLPPGNWTEVEVNGSSSYVYVQDEDTEVGPGKMTFLQQAMVYNAEAKGWTFPPSSGIERIDPIDPQFLIKAAEYLYLCMLRAADQEHTLMSGDAVASAVSRVESRAQFVWSLLETKVHVEAMLRWLLETALLLAANLMAERVVEGTGEGAVRRVSDGGKALVERYKALRARVDVHASAGPLAPDEKRVVIEQYQAGVMSRETAIVMLGTEDVDAEILLLDEDKSSQLDILQKQGEVFAVWSAVLDAQDAMLIATGVKTPMEIMETINARGKSDPEPATT